MKTNLVEVEDVHRSLAFGGRDLHILRGISFSVQHTFLFFAVPEERFFPVTNHTDSHL
jgi:predicted ABC-type transport system involved in lysophospholipase L1 biosynthesis ATPase subunit